VDETYIFSTDIRKTFKYQIRPVTAELFHADGQTDIKKLTVAFRSFTKASKKRNKRENGFHRRGNLFDKITG
jgi:hypothetical protein